MISALCSCRFNNKGERGGREVFLKTKHLLSFSSFCVIWVCFLNEKRLTSLYYLSVPSSLVIIGPLANVNKNWQKDRSLKQITCLWQIDTISRERETQMRALTEQLFSKRQQPAHWSADMSWSVFQNSHDMSNCFSCSKHWEVWRRWRRAVPP